MEYKRIDMIKTGKNILTYRKNNKLTVKDLQEIFNFGTPNAIYRWQRGETIPTIDNLVVLSSVFNVKIDDIIATE